MRAERDALNPTTCVGWYWYWYCHGHGHGHGHARGAGWRCESLDYDMFESRVNQDFAIDQLREKRTFGAIKWVFTLLIGAFTAMTAIFIDYGVKLLEEQRLGEVHRTYASGARGAAAATYVAISAAMVLVAATLVGVVEPVAGGSGIPEIKTMLNGIKVPRAVRAKTLICKAVGVLFSVAGGLPCGKEGPMIHSGAIVGAAVSQGKSAIFGFDLSFSRFVGFRSEKEKRETRRARRAKIGQDLFATQADKPFVFPPKWTFVFRAFSTIDGISKGLTRTYDLSRISQPFLKELANLRDGSTTTTALRTAGKRLGLRPKDLGQVVTQPRRVAEIVERVRRIEDGDVKLRVRTVEVERMLDRLEERQTMIGAALGAALLYQLALRAAGALNRYAMGAGAVKLLWESWRARERMRKMVEQQLRFANEGSQKYDEEDLYTGKQDVGDDLDGSGEACVAGDEPMDIACADDD